MTGISNGGRAASLSDRLLAPANAPYVTADCVTLVKQRINGQKGASGAVIKSGFKLVQKIRPDFVEKAVRKLLPHFCHAIEPHYSQWQSGAQNSWHQHVMEHHQELTAALLTVSDRKADNIENKAISKLYQRLRPRAQQELLLAIPDLAALTAKYIDI